MKYKVLDLFCGAGGMSRGFLDADFDVVLGVDHDDAALITFEKNHGKTQALKIDLFDHTNIRVIEDYLKSKGIEIDVLIGGPPCQGFSLAGKREEGDERNLLYSAMVKTSKLLKPQVIVIENVPGLLTLYEGKAKERIFKDFEDIGYKMSVKILYAPYFGVPQIRKRAFFVGLLESENEFIYPSPILKEEDFITCGDAIRDLPSLEGDMNFSLDVVRDYISDADCEYQRIMRARSSKVHNHFPTNHALKTIQNISLVPEGGNYKDLPKHLSGKFTYHESLTRYHSGKPSRTIDTGHRTHFHYKYNRIPTVRENARLQSFPDDFIFFGSKQQQYKQVGNAVPPLLGKAIAEKIKEYLNENKV